MTDKKKPTLPEKWAIQTSDPRFYDWFNKLEGVNEGEMYPYKDNDQYIHYPSLFVGFGIRSYSQFRRQEGYELITLDFLMECIGDFGPAKFLPNAILDSTTRQPIAYKVKTQDFAAFNQGDILSDFKNGNWCKNNESYHCFSQKFIDKLGPDYFEPIYSYEEVDYMKDILLKLAKGNNHFECIIFGQKRICEIIQIDLLNFNESKCKILVKFKEQDRLDMLVDIVIGLKKDFDSTRTHGTLYQLRK